eukprot:3348653-Amphidinium_carterae.1
MACTRSFQPLRPLLLTLLSEPVAPFRQFTVSRDSRLITSLTPGMSPRLWWFAGDASRLRTDSGGCLSLWAARFVRVSAPKAMWALGTARIGLDVLRLRPREVLGTLLLLRPTSACGRSAWSCAASGLARSPAVPMD